MLRKFPKQNENLFSKAWNNTEINSIQSHTYYLDAAESYEDN